MKAGRVPTIHDPWRQYLHGRAVRDPRLATERRVCLRVRWGCKPQRLGYAPMQSGVQNYFRGVEHLTISVCANPGGKDGSCEYPRS